MNIARFLNVVAVICFLAAPAALRAQDEGRPEKPRPTAKNASNRKKPGVSGEGASHELRGFATVNAVMRRYTPLFKAAHKRHVPEGKAGEGGLILEFAILPAGSVKDVKITESDFSKYPEFEKEIIAKAGKAKFQPIPKGETKAVFPLSFGGSGGE
ncbi:MAG: energy transducer TonB [Deltaproteobacteria bacterium]|nr:energy transducer TonB [Deltaproteobacteria bacterium]